MEGSLYRSDASSNVLAFSSDNSYFSENNLKLSLLECVILMLSPAQDGTDHVATCTTIIDLVYRLNFLFIHSSINCRLNTEHVYAEHPPQVIAGEPDFNVTVKESGAVFKFNFAQVLFLDVLTYYVWYL